MDIKKEIDTVPYEEFAKEKLGFNFKDISLLVTALTHRSYVNEHKSTMLHHNERLEFLGDAILEFVSSDYLYRNFDETEGIMTAWRSALVRTESIGDAGKILGYAPLIRLSKGERCQGTDRARDVIVADCFEAIIGAIYLDQGFETAKNFIEKNILVKMKQILDDESWRDAKTYFQELAQHFDNATPTYHTVREDGPDHDKTFTIAAYVGGAIRGSGTGHCKQDAEQLAAREGIKYYKKLKAREKSTNQ